MRKHLHKFLLMGVAAFGTQNAVADDTDAFNAHEADLQHMRIAAWDEEYRNQVLTTPQELPAFMAPIKEAYLAEAAAFIEREPESTDEFKHEYPELIDALFQLLTRYYYLQIQYGELCYGAEHAAALAEYRKGVENDITRLAWQMLKECVWCDACIWTGGADDSHPVNQAIAATVVSPDFGETLLLDNMLATLLQEKAQNNADLRSYGALMPALRASRLCDIAAVLADLNYYTEDNLLTAAKWGTVETGAKAAALVVQQFDTWRQLMLQAGEGRLFMPYGLAFYAGTMHSFNKDIFYSNQEAFLRRALHWDTYQQSPAASVPAEPQKKDEVASATESAVAATPQPQCGHEAEAVNRLLLISVPAWAVLSLLLGLYMGRRFKK